MKKIDPYSGISTLVNHVAEGFDPSHAHIMPIYQTSTFSYPDVPTGAAISQGREAGLLLYPGRQPKRLAAGTKDCIPGRAGAAAG